VTAVRVGRLAAGLVVSLTAAGCGLVGGGGGGYEVTAYFTRGVALYEQGQVRVLGLPAGRVLEVATEEACPVEEGGTVPCVRVRLRIDDDVELPVDAFATLIPQSLIGERYVQLTPAYDDQMAADGVATLDSLDDDERVIPLSRTIVPVEPDEALAAVNDFLENLNPEGLGRLIENAEEALDGQGADLGNAITSITDLVDTFAQRDDELAAIVDNFDAFTQTLVTREDQIGEVIQSFARTANVLAQERQSLQTLLSSLAEVSTEGFDLVSEHAVALRTDLATLGELAQSLVANLDSVGRLLDSGPLLVDGLAGAINTDLRAVNLVSSLGPIAGNVVNPILEQLGLPPLCPPIDTVPVGDCIGAVIGQQHTAPVVTEVAPPRTPIDDVLAVLGSPLAPTTSGGGAGLDDRVADGAGALGRFLRDAAETLSGVGG
jgi:phospholipid/cholesterol/gamma-HCH transport system substrate-binding protein